MKKFMLLLSILLAASFASATCSTPQIISVSSAPNQGGRATVLVGPFNGCITVLESLSASLTAAGAPGNGYPVSVTCASSQTTLWTINLAVSGGGWQSDHVTQSNLGSPFCPAGQSINMGFSGVQSNVWETVNMVVSVQ